MHTGPLARVAGRVLLPLLILASIVVVLGYAVFPTRTWLDQRATIAERQDELAALDAEIAELTDTVRLLGTDAEIERIARVDHGLVKPGRGGLRRAAGGSRAGSDAGGLALRHPRRSDRLTRSARLPRRAISPGRCQTVVRMWHCRRL